jgi:hypothetical protein
MSDFTRTLIVDCDLIDPTPPFFNNIHDAAWALNPANNDDRWGIGGTIIVERGTYEIDGTSGKETVSVPSNVSIISHGATIQVTASNVSAFTNADQTNGNERIRISGFKIILGESGSLYSNHLIHLKRVNNCIIEKLFITDESTHGVRWYAAICLDGDGGECCHNTIRRNFIECFGKNFGDQDNYAYGIFLDTNCSKNIVKNNYVSNCCTNLYLHNSHSNILTGNVLNDSQLGPHLNGCDGILTGDSYSIFTGNICSQSIEHGIYSAGGNGCVFSGNVIDNSSNRGIQLNAGGVAAKHNIVNGNVCYSNHDGILCGFYTQQTVVMGNSSCNNTRYGILESCNSDAVSPGNAWKNTYVGNMCQGNYPIPDNKPVGQIALGYEYAEGYPTRILLDTDPIAADNVGSICEKTV